MSTNYNYNKRTLKAIKYIILCCVVLLASAAIAQDWKTDTPEFLTTPDKVKSTIGTLQFKDGYSPLHFRV